MNECLKCGKCCYLSFYSEDFNFQTDTKCPHLTKENLCSVYGNRPAWCMNTDEMKKLNLLPIGCGYRGDK